MHANHKTTFAITSIVFGLSLFVTFLVSSNISKPNTLLTSSSKAQEEPPACSIELIRYNEIQCRNGCLQGRGQVRLKCIGGPNDGKQFWYAAPTSEDYCEVPSCIKKGRDWEKHLEDNNDFIVEEYCACDLAEPTSTPTPTLTLTTMPTPTPTLIPEPEFCYNEPCFDDSHCSNGMKCVNINHPIGDVICNENDPCRCVINTECEAGAPELCWCPNPFNPALPIIREPIPTLSPTPTVRYDYPALPIIR